jgi:hypothetical protein
MISQADLKSQLNYDPASGIFTWVVVKRGLKGRTIAGSLNPEGYRRITVNGRRYMAHVLAWLYMTGEWRLRGVDHRDTNRDNNSWHNLRAATQSQNNMNMRARSDNALGVKCVQRKKGAKNKPFYATIRVNGKQHQLGYCATIEEAAATYESAARQHFGEFARTK